MRAGIVACIAVFLIACAGIALVARPAAAPQPQGVYVLRYASPYPPSHPFSRSDIAWITHVEAVSKGRLKIQPFWGGSLISSDYSMIELRHGVADIALITPIYAPAGALLLKTQSGFYDGADTIQKQVAVYRCLAPRFPAFARELEGLHVLAVQGGNLPNVITRDRPVPDLKALSGLRLRAPEELIPVFARFGVDGVAMPMAEVYSAMSKGIIDGVAAPADTLKTLHFDEVGHYLNLLVLPRGAYPARAISDQAWNRLPPDLQKVLTDSQGVWEAALARDISGDEKAGLAVGRAHGVKFVSFDPAGQAAFNRAYDEVGRARGAALREHGIPGEAIFDAAQTLARGDARCAS